MAKRLIDSADLIAKLPIVEEDKQISLIGAVADVVTMISECKPVDAVEVVRCKDCKHMEIAMGELRWCNAWNAINGMGDYGYCNYGERKEGWQRLNVNLVKEATPRMSGTMAKKTTSIAVDT